MSEPASDEKLVPQDDLERCAKAAYYHGLRSTNRSWEECSAKEYWRGLARDVVDAYLNLSSADVS